MFKIGYYTYYSLSVENEDNFSKEELVKASRALAEITNIVKPSYIKDDTDYPFYWISEDSMKWYDYDRDMTKLGELFPDMIFVLYGEGEDRDDNWRLIIKGKNCDFQRAHIHYGPRPGWSY